MIATTMKNALLVGVLAAICLTETRAYVSFDQVNLDNKTESDLPKSAVPGQGSDATTEKLIRVPLIRRYPRTIDRSLATINENDPQEPERNTVTARPATTEATRGVRRGAKRNQKKLKLTQTQGRKKSKKTRRHVGADDKQDNVDGQNHLRRFGGSVARSYKNEDYYAQRRAVMEKFYARQREIAQKYQTSTTTQGPFRYDLLLPNATTENSRYNSRVTPFIPNTRPASTAKPLRSPANDNWLSPVEEDADVDTTSYDDYEENDYDAIDAGKATPVASKTEAAPVATSTLAPVAAGGKITEIGDCVNVENSLFYQHNLLVDVTKGTTVETDELMESINEEYCVVCIRIEQSAGTEGRLKIERSGNKSVKLKIEALRNEHLAFVARFYTGDRSTRSKDCL
nr:uncharacterized protein LOC117221600 [Megalopta genalis]